jgi:hypothetical protein
LPSLSEKRILHFFDPVHSARADRARACRHDSASKPEIAILRAVDDGHFALLLLMCVHYRSVDQRIYFEPKVERILKQADCAVAFTVS